MFGAKLQRPGCAGLASVAYGLIMQELERGDSGAPLLRVGAGRRSSCTRSTRFGSEEQKDRWLPALAKGEAIGCFGLTEPITDPTPGDGDRRAGRAISVCSTARSSGSLTARSPTSLPWAKDESGEISNT